MVQYLIDKKVLGIILGLSDDELKGAYQSYLSQELDLTNKILYEYFQGMKVPKERIDSYYESMGRLFNNMDSDNSDLVDLVMNSLNEQFKDIENLVTADLENLIDDAVFAYRKGYYDLAQKTLSSEKIDELNNYLLEVEAELNKDVQGDVEGQGRQAQEDQVQVQSQAQLSQEQSQGNSQPQMGKQEAQASPQLQADPQSQPRMGQRPQVDSQPQQVQSPPSVGREAQASAAQGAQVGVTKEPQSEKTGFDFSNKEKVGSAIDNKVSSVATDIYDDLVSEVGEGEGKEQVQAKTQPQSQIQSKVQEQPQLQEQPQPQPESQPQPQAPSVNPQDVKPVDVYPPQ